MLAERIHNTLRFFDLQNLPLTAYELHQYLITDTATLKTKLDDQHELLDASVGSANTSIHFDTILTQLYILSREGKLTGKNGFYSLPGREEIITVRQKNYINGLKREKLIARFLLPTRHIPFVRSIGLGGSQAFGQQRPTSDIDLLIVTDTKHMWIARTLLSAWFHVLGVRRHGKKIANRFCLNHYLANSRAIASGRNLYTAMEYTRLRPIIYPEGVREFQEANQPWINQFFPNISFQEAHAAKQSKLQKFLEKLFTNFLGNWLENQLGRWQQRRIKEGEFVSVKEDELSFHPESKQVGLLEKWFSKT